MVSKQYIVRKEIHIDYAHHIAGHPGACLNIHGHTWSWQVSLTARSLNYLGMVMDFSAIKKNILLPVHDLLDHSLVLNSSEYACDKLRGAFESIGKAFGANRVCVPLDQQHRFRFAGSEVHFPGGIKVVTFPFVPTCETLAGWFFDLAKEQINILGEYPRVEVESVCVFEQLHPTTSCCTVTG